MAAGAIGAAALAGRYIFWPVGQPAWPARPQPQAETGD